MGRRLAAAGILVFSLASPVFSAEELHVSAQVDRTELRQGETLVFEIEISGPLRETPKIHLGKLEGFMLVSSGQSQQIRMGGAQMSQTLVLVYTLSALEAGTWTLGPVQVEYRGKNFETAPIEVKVLPGPPRTPPAKEPEHRAPQLEGEVIL